MAKNTLSVNITANTSEAQGEIDKLQAKVEQISAGSLKKQLKEIKTLMTEALKSGDSTTLNNLSQQAQKLEQQLNSLPKPMKSLKQAAREAKNEVQKMSMAGLKSGDKMFDEAVKKAGELERKMKTTTAVIEKSADAASSIHGLEEAFGAVGVVSTQASAAVKTLTGSEVDLSGASQSLAEITGALNGALALKSALGAKSYFQTQILTKITETYNKILAAQNIQEGTSGMLKAGLTAKTVVMTAAQTAYNVVLSITKFLMGDFVGIALMVGTAIVGVTAYFISAKSEQAEYNASIQNTINAHSDLIASLNSVLDMYSREEVAAFYNEMIKGIKDYKEAMEDKASSESDKLDKTEKILQNIADKEKLIISQEDMAKLAAMDQEKAARLLAIAKKEQITASKDLLKYERITAGFSDSRLTYLKHLAKEYKDLQASGKSTANVVKQWEMNFKDVIDKGFTLKDVIKAVEADAEHANKQFDLMSTEFKDSLQHIRENGYEIQGQFKSMAAIWNSLDNKTKIREFDTIQEKLRQMGIYVQNMSDAEAVFGQNAKVVARILGMQAEVQGMNNYAGELRAKHALAAAMKNDAGSQKEASFLSGQIDIVEKRSVELMTNLTKLQAGLKFFNQPKTTSSSQKSSSSRSSSSSSSSSSPKSLEDQIGEMTLKQLEKQYGNGQWEKEKYSVVKAVADRLHSILDKDPNLKRKGLLSQKTFAELEDSLKITQPPIADTDLKIFGNKYTEDVNKYNRLKLQIQSKYYKENLGTNKVKEVDKAEYDRYSREATYYRYFYRRPSRSIQVAEQANEIISELNDKNKLLEQYASFIVQKAIEGGEKAEQISTDLLNNVVDVLGDEAGSHLSELVSSMFSQLVTTVVDKNGISAFNSKTEATLNAQNYIKNANIEDAKPFIYLNSDGKFESAYTQKGKMAYTPSEIPEVETNETENPYANFKEQTNDFNQNYYNLAKDTYQKGNSIDLPRTKNTESNKQLGTYYEPNFDQLSSADKFEAIQRLYELNGNLTDDFEFDLSKYQNLSKNTVKTLITLLVTNSLNKSEQLATPQLTSDEFTNTLIESEDFSNFVKGNKVIDWEGLQKYFSKKPQKITDNSSKFLLNLFKNEYKQNGINGNFMSVWKDNNFFGQREENYKNSDTDFQNNLQEKQDAVEKFKENLNEMQKVTSTVSNSISSIFGQLANDSSKQWAKLATEIAKFAGSIVTSALGVVSAYLTMSAAKAVGNSSKDIISFAISVAAAATTLTVGIISLTQNLKKHAQGGILGKFAQGANSMSGVFSGNSVGDMNIARVNGGEMILNKNQQSRLFKQLNQPNNSQNNTNQKVQFVIRGKDLYGTLSNYQNISQKL